VLVKDSEKFWSLSRKTWLPAKTVALYLSSKHGVPFTYKDLPDCNPDL